MNSKKYLSIGVWLLLVISVGTKIVVNLRGIIRAIQLYSSNLWDVFFYWDLFFHVFTQFWVLLYVFFIIAFGLALLGILSNKYWGAFLAGTMAAVDVIILFMMSSHTPNLFDIIRATSDSLIILFLSYIEFKRVSGPIPASMPIAKDRRVTILITVLIISTMIAMVLYMDSVHKEKICIERMELETKIKMMESKINASRMELDKKLRLIRYNYTMIMPFYDKNNSRYCILIDYRETICEDDCIVEFLKEEELYCVSCPNKLDKKICGREPLFPSSPPI